MALIYKVLFSSISTFETPPHVSVKHAFSGTHLHLRMPFREMLLTKYSVAPG
jgi:hypothetical protein